MIGVDWVHLAQDGDECRAVVNAVRNVFGSIVSNTGQDTDDCLLLSCPVLCGLN